MRPILLKGHERSITVVKYNKDGDLLFTASKDHVPSVWDAFTGERRGTFHGHKGTIWDLDISSDSHLMATASADASTKIFSCETGVCLLTLAHFGPVRGVAWSDGNRMLATISDPFVDHPGQIRIYDFNALEMFGTQDYGSLTEENVQELLEPRVVIELPKIDYKGKRVNATNVSFLNLNEALFVTFDNGAVRLYDVENGDELEEVQAHEKKINRVSFNKSKTLFITSSADHTSKLFDVVNLEELKIYKTDRPVNDAVIHPTKPHIVLGGGQEAMSVTTTSGKVGKFEARFFYMVYEEEFATVKGHFGPINALDINPNGLSYASGAEDGYVRLHFFDRSYIDMRDPVPEENDDDDDSDSDDKDAE